MSNDEKWIKHLRKLAADNANLGVIVRGLRLEVTALQDDVDHYKREYARQNARIITMAIQLEVDKCPNVKAHAPVEEDGSNPEEDKNPPDLTYTAASDMMFRGVIPPGFDQIKQIDCEADDAGSRSNSQLVELSESGQESKDS